MFGKSKRGTEKEKEREEITIVENDEHAKKRKSETPPPSDSVVITKEVIAVKENAQGKQRGGREKEKEEGKLLQRSLILMDEADNTHSDGSSLSCSSAQHAHTFTRTLFLSCLYLSRLLCLTFSLKCA